MSRQQSQLLAEIELLESIRKMSPEERKKHFRQEMYRELKVMEMERRARVAQVECERRRRETEERDIETERLRFQKERAAEERRRQEAKRREEEEKKVNEEKELEKLNQEMLQLKVVKAEEKPINRVRATLYKVRREQQRRRREAEAAQTISTVKIQKHRVRKPLINNWVGEQDTYSVTACPAAGGESLQSESV